MQDKPLRNTSELDQESISLKDVFTKLGREITYLKSKWLLIVGFGLLVGALGFAFSVYKKPIYTATSSFVLDDGGKGGGLGQYQGLAALAGINIGDGGGIFQGDNILELYRSRVMIEKTLLSEVTTEGKQELLIDRYIDMNNLRKEWDESPSTKSISFAGNPLKFSRTQDSIVTDIVQSISKNILNVSKPDKKLSIIRVEVNANDELFAKEFNSKLVETVNNFYTQTKTKKSAQNVQILQRQADSVKSVLNNSISGVAAAVDAAPNANPALTSLRVPSQRRQIDVQAASAIYSEIVKNLEISKISLRQEIPLVQVIDEPVLPLMKTKAGKVKSVIIGFTLGIFIASAWLLCGRFFKMLMA